MLIIYRCLTLRISNLGKAQRRTESDIERAAEDGRPVRERSLISGERERAEFRQNKPAFGVQNNTKDPEKPKSLDQRTGPSSPSTNKTHRTLSAHLVPVIIRLITCFCYLIWNIWIVRPIASSIIRFGQGGNGFRAFLSIVLPNSVSLREHLNCDLRDKPTINSFQCSNGFQIFLESISNSTPASRLCAR